tara:strand:+ start:6976 stop:7173 length:198 start_codon:yes stop_codon:yes gene_type:complete
LTRTSADFGGDTCFGDFELIGEETERVDERPTLVVAEVGRLLDRAADVGLLLSPAAALRAWSSLS